MGPEHSQGYMEVKATLERNKIPMVLLNKDNFNQHIPNVNLAEGDSALVDVTAGVLFADRALRTVQVERRWFPSDLRGDDYTLYLSKKNMSEPIIYPNILTKRYLRLQR